jgi:hypothetical protein
LLKQEEIKAITGSLIEQSNNSERSNGSFRISQCVYIAHQANQSISLVVTLADPAAKQKKSPREFWRERFGRFREEKEGKDEEVARDRKTEAGENEEGRPPRKINGLGAEAFWTAGSLYVLHKEAFLRLSIGGSDSEEKKLEHAKALAALALKRM